MADFDNTNRGVLFRQYEKESDKHPDYTGELNVEGKTYRLAGWKRQSKNGAAYVSLSLSEPQKPQKPQVDSVADVPDEPINLNDIPF